MKKVMVKNQLTEKMYTAYNTKEKLLFTKKEMQKIIKETNDVNRMFDCDIAFSYDKKTDCIVCEDKEFKNKKHFYERNTIKDILGVFKMYDFGNEIEWEII